MDAFNANIVLLLYGAATSAPLFSSLTIFFAEWFPFLLIAFAISYKFFFHESGKIFWSLVSLFSSPFIALAFVKLCKFIEPSPRPFADGLRLTPLISVSDPFGSFPSVHAAFFGALATAMFFENKRMGVWCFFAALLIGISRVATGVHFPSDIIAGLLLGALVSIFANMFYRMRITLWSKK